MLDSLIVSLDTLFVTIQLVLSSGLGFRVIRSAKRGPWSSSEAGLDKPTTLLYSRELASFSDLWNPNPVH